MVNIEGESREPSVHVDRNKVVIILELLIDSAPAIRKCVSGDRPNNKGRRQKLRTDVASSAEWAQLYGEELRLDVEGGKAIVTVCECNNRLVDVTGWY
jgi:hypothetical protein